MSCATLNSNSKLFASAGKPPPTSSVLNVQPQNHNNGGREYGSRNGKEAECPSSLSSGRKRKSLELSSTTDDSERLFGGASHSWRSQADGSLGLRRRYSFESFELRTGSSSCARGGGIGTWHKFSGLLALPTLEPIPPSPIGDTPSCALNNSPSQGDNLERGEGSSIESPNFSKSASPRVKEPEAKSNGSDEKDDHEMGLSGTAERQAKTPGCDSNTSKPSEGGIHLHHVEPGNDAVNNDVSMQTATFLLDELFFESVLAFAYLERMVRWLHFTFHRWGVYHRVKTFWRDSVTPLFHSSGRAVCQMRSFLTPLRDKCEKRINPRSESSLPPPPPQQSSFLPLPSQGTPFPSEFVGKPLVAVVVTLVLAMVLFLLITTSSVPISVTEQCMSIGPKQMSHSLQCQEQLLADDCRTLSQCNSNTQHGRSSSSTGGSDDSRVVFQVSPMHHGSSSTESSHGEERSSNVKERRERASAQFQSEFGGERTVWFVLSVLFTIVASSFALTLLLVYCNKTHYYNFAAHSAPHHILPTVCSYNDSQRLESSSSSSFVKVHLLSSPRQGDEESRCSPSKSSSSLGDEVLSSGGGGEQSSNPCLALNELAALHTPPESRPTSDPGNAKLSRGGHEDDSLCKWSSGGKAWKTSDSSLEHPRYRRHSSNGYGGDGFNVTAITCESASAVVHDGGKSRVRRDESQPDQLVVLSHNHHCVIGNGSKSHYGNGREARSCFRDRDKAGKRNPHLSLTEEREARGDSSVFLSSLNYFLAKFDQPDKVLFPIFWTALVVDFNFPNCVPLAHTILLALAIKLINCYHHKCYFARLARRGLPTAHHSNHLDDVCCERVPAHENYRNPSLSPVKVGRKGRKQGESSSVKFSREIQEEPSSATKCSGKTRGVEARSKSCDVSTTIPSLPDQRLRESPLEDSHCNGERSWKRKNRVELLFSPEERNNLLRRSSKLTAGLLLYFIVIRRLGSLIPVLGSPALTHVLGIVGLLLGQCFAERLSWCKHHHHRHHHLPSVNSDNCCCPQHEHQRNHNNYLVCSFKDCCWRQCASGKVTNDRDSSHLETCERKPAATKPVVKGRGESRLSTTSLVRNEVKSNLCSGKRITFNLDCGATSPMPKAPVTELGAVVLSSSLSSRGERDRLRKEKVPGLGSSIQLDCEGNHLGDETHRRPLHTRSQFSVDNEDESVGLDELVESGENRRPSRTSLSRSSSSSSCVSQSTQLRSSVSLSNSSSSGSLVLGSEESSSHHLLLSGAPSQTAPPHDVVDRGEVLETDPNGNTTTTATEVEEHSFFADHISNSESRLDNGGRTATFHLGEEGYATDEEDYLSFVEPSEEATNDEDDNHDELSMRQALFVFGADAYDGEGAVHTWFPPRHDPLSHRAHPAPPAVVVQSGSHMSCHKGFTGVKKNDSVKPLTSGASSSCATTRPPTPPPSLTHTSIFAGKTYISQKFISHSGHHHGDGGGGGSVGPQDEGRTISFPRPPPATSSTTTTTTPCRVTSIGGDSGGGGNNSSVKVQYYDEISCNSNSSSPPSTAKRLFRSGSQCCVSSTSSPVLHQGTSSTSTTPPQQLISAATVGQQNHQGSVEKYLSSKMRRTSLPALPAPRTAIHHGPAGVDTAILYEAHGLVTEMLLDQTALPANIVAGLKALATLLKPTPTSTIHYPSPRPKPVPLTLSVDPDYTSDFDEIPYTGEKISTMPKRNSGQGKKGVSANLLRRMSTSTWTTTTSATGMPTLEPQPHTRRRRSASYRSSALDHSRRRYSQHELSSHGQRKTVCSLHPLSPSDLTHLSALAASTGFSSGGNAIKSASASVSAAGSNRSSPASTPIPSPLPSPVPSRDPSPCNHRTGGGRQHRDSLTQADASSTSLNMASSTEHIGPSSTVYQQQQQAPQPQPLQRSSPSPSANGNLLSLKGSFSGSSGGGVGGVGNTTSGSSSSSVFPNNNPPVTSSSPTNCRQRDYSPPKVLFHSSKPDSGSFAVLGGGDEGEVAGCGEAGSGIDGDSLGLLSGKNPDEDNCSTTSTLGDGPGPPDNSSGNSNSLRLSPVTFTLQEPPDNNEPYFSADDEGREDVIVMSDGIRFDLQAIAVDPLLCRLHEWDYQIFDLERSSRTQILSHMCYKVFLETGLFETFRIPIKEFITYFHALEMGYRDKPYHNRMHASDVLHGVYYLTSQAIPGFQMVPADPETPSASDISGQRAWFNVDEASYGIMGANFTSLELMALYVAAAMHDYDHPGRTNAFLVSTHAKEAILYNDRSVLENHHAAAAWSLLLSHDDCNFLKYLDKAEFKRFRYLVIEAILATDLKRHFEIVAEFNSKVNEHDSPGIDWTQEDDRLLVMEVCIKLADINGPCKVHDIHVQWTYRIAEEFYEQGDEETELGLPISPFMDRDHPQLARLQESFINHLVAPLCKACVEAGILPGYWIEDVDDDGDGDGDVTTADDLSIATTSCQETDNENDESSYSDDNPTNFKCNRKVFCLQTKHLQDNHRHWMGVIKEESKKKDEIVPVKTESVAISTEDPMETIEEENNTPHSLNRSFSFEKEDSKL